MYTKKPMIRKQLYIEPEQNLALREHAAKYHVSEGQIVREAVNAYLMAGAEPQEIDLDAWSEERKFIVTRQTNVKNGTDTAAERAWTRSELYDV